MVFQEDRFWVRQIGIVGHPWKASAVRTQCVRRIFHLLSLDWFRRQKRHMVLYGLAGTGFGIRNVHEKPNTIVRPCGRALAEYSS